MGLNNFIVQKGCFLCITLYFHPHSGWFLCFAHKCAQLAKTTNAGKRGYPRFPEASCFYSPSGSANFFGSSSISWSAFLLSSSTATAAAVNTPTIPANAPPINAHVLLIRTPFSCDITKDKSNLLSA